MKKYSNLGGTLLCLGEILVGILLLIDPAGFTSTILIAGGIILAASGLYHVIWYFITDPEEAAEGNRMGLGLISLAAGLFCIFRTQWLMDFFSLLTTLYGAAILAIGLGKVQTTVDRIRMKFSRWYFPAIGALATLVCGTVILIDPFAASAALWQFIGISLICEAVLDAVSLIACRSRKTEDVPAAPQEK